MKSFCNHLDKPLEFVKNITGDEINMAGGKRSVWRCKDCGKVILRSTPFIQGKVSDGSHTFDELYHHRAILFSVICNEHPELAWKSKQHHEGGGPMYNGMFIVGIETPGGQATYHYDINPYWNLFHVKELVHAPEWDGHTPEQAIERIQLLSQEAEVVSTVTPPPNDPLTLDELREMDGEPIWIKSKHWKHPVADVVNNVARTEGRCYTRLMIHSTLQENGYGKSWIAYRHKPEEDAENG